MNDEQANKIYVMMREKVDLVRRIEVLTKMIYAAEQKGYVPLFIQDLEISERVAISHPEIRGLMDFMSARLESLNLQIAVL
jgi:hypothetical protein